jgi:GNAT superfamily N-acetyltransferase
MMRNFAEFEKLLDYFKTNEERLTEVMFESGQFVDGLIAEDDSQLVGYALFYPCFGSFSGQRGIYLEDLYIERAYRGKGVGEAMLIELAGIARDRGCERIDFQVLEWNTNAINFYEKLGATRDNDERHFKFTGQAFKNLVKKSGQ